jgi:3-deoxy-D-manno-octulosonic-acid transferase
MTRALYTALLWLAAPLLLLRLVWRSRRMPGYRRNLGERWGALPGSIAPGAIWIHAVSVGETRAAAIVIKALHRLDPQIRILLTHMTPTGRAAGEELFGETVARAWLPYDYPFAVRRFLDRARPRLGLVLETEIWPNLIAECRARGTPLFLVNARMSPDSARGYARVASLAREALAGLSGVAAQTEADAERLRALGAPEVAVTGNIKFDLEVDPVARIAGDELRDRFGRSRRVWMAASTREGEEALILERLRDAGLPERTLTVIVPRHPQRFDEVAALAASRGFKVARRSDPGAIGPEVEVVVGDSMGEMLAYYHAADCALMGGSLLPFGGQNLIEACAMGTPVVLGPHTYNFEQAAESAIGAGAALRAGNATEAMAKVAALLADAVRRERMGRAALDFAAANRGAVGRLLDWLGDHAK